MLRLSLDHAVWRLSSGTAAVAGLAHARLDCPPTTAYVMLGERCAGDCAFCAQARSSRARSDLLSRVTWPDFGADEAADAISQACASDALRRVCFQVTTVPGHIDRAVCAVRDMRSRTDRPICVSVAVRDQADIERLLTAGASRVTLAIDAASERVYQQVKSGSWPRTRELLSTAVHRYPDQIGTHLIMGLGETEQELVSAMQEYADLGISIGLFAFTPIPGTRLAHHPPPALEAYRRVQVARWLILNGHGLAATFGYDGQRRIRSYALGEPELTALISDTHNSPFRTAGCADCNRPYYNERPGGVMYNYPRALTPAEVNAEVTDLVLDLNVRPSPIRNSVQRRTPYGKDASV